MKTYTTIFLCLALSFTISAQQIQLLESFKHTHKTEINLLEGKLQVKNKTDNNSSSGILDFGLEIRNNELAISYKLSPLSGTEQYYLISLQAEYNNQSLDINTQHLKKPAGEIIKQGGLQTMLWTNILEEYINLDGELKLSLQVEWWGDLQKLYGVDCNIEPSFTAKQRLPYYLVAGGGVAAITTGILFKLRSNDIYDDEYLNAGAENAQSLYDDANNKHQMSLILGYSGAAIIIADVALYLIRQAKYKKDLERYNKYCPKTLSFSPIFKLPSPEFPNGQTGLGLSVTF